jgi:hypothetical protein
MKPFYQSKTFWGIMIGVLAPTVTQMTGVNVTSGIEFIKNLSETGTSTYSLKDWLQLTGQAIGTVLIIWGTIDKNRKPLTFK